MMANLVNANIMLGQNNDDNLINTIKLTDCKHNVKI